MDRPAPPLPHDADAPVRPASRAFVVLAVVAWCVLAALALRRADGVLAVACALVLVVVVLAPRLAARKAAAWLVLAGFIAALGLLAWSGHGGLALEALPVAVSLALAWLFGHTLVGTRRPLIARVILVLEGEDRLAMRGVAGYARALTLAWALLMLVQALVFGVLLAARHGLVGWPPRAFADAWLLVGGWGVPLAFMLGELAFRRRRLAHVPHDPPRVFLRRLAASWPRLLRDTVG